MKTVTNRKGFTAFEDYLDGQRFRLRNGLVVIKATADHDDPRACEYEGEGRAWDAWRSGGTFVTASALPKPEKDIVEAL